MTALAGDDSSTTRDRGKHRPPGGSPAGYAVAPGEYLEEWIEGRGLSLQHAAGLLGCSPGHAGEIIAGRAPVTGDTAARLEQVTGIPAATWLRYETAYRADLARIAGAALAVLHEAPAGEAGWDLYLSGQPATRITELSQLNDAIADALGHGCTLVALVGADPCEAPGCPLAATAARLSAGPSWYTLTRSCPAHDPGEEPGVPSCVIPPWTRADRAYARDDEGTTRLTAALAGCHVPGGVLDQPRCEACDRRITPGPLIPLAWADEAGGRDCPATGAAHSPAPSPVTAAITRHAASAAGIATAVRAARLQDAAAAGQPGAGAA
jgi:addiction module HigA family antidote